MEAGNILQPTCLKRQLHNILDTKVAQDVILAISKAPEEVDKKSEKPLWNPDDILQPKSSARSSPDERIKEKKRCAIDHPIEFIDLNILGTWTLENICKAGKLLRKPPITVTFNDEHEMRKVYSLIYDVYRYKNVLIQALNDIAFYAHFPQLRNHENRVWLMLFELYARHFLKRSGEDVEQEINLYKEADLNFIAKSLWKHRVRLAASISRLRIKNGALNLSELLPIHLQDEKVAIAAANPIVSGWMNPFKLKDKGLAEEQLKKFGFTEVADKTNVESPLRENQYKWDKVCPLFMTCLPADRSEFARSEFVQNNFFVMQDKTFALAPAIISKLLDHFQLDGDIVQTHVSSPRSVAYLGALFHSINRVNNYMAFGAGSNLLEYSNYIASMGIDNVRLYPEKFCSIPLDSPILERVVGIFATPPNSFSGVPDPIDLICSRGGDLSMLEVLTESEISQDGKKRVALLLEEQRETLRLAMSRPQVQFILYETHSIVGSENQDMVQRAVDDINRCAFEKHLAAYQEKKRLEALAEAELANIPSAALTQPGPRKRGPTSAKSEESGGKVRIGKDTMGTSKDSQGSDMETSSEDITQHVKVPKTDEFTVASVPDMCLNQDNCIDFSTMGCYVSLIQRKQITKLDAKYLIKMAEARGLFGNSDRKKSSKPKSSKKPEKKATKSKDDDNSCKRTRVKKDDVATLVERLNQPTHASLVRSNVPTLSFVSNKSLTFNVLRKSCSRHSKHHGEDYTVASTSALMSTLHLDTRAKQWWRETADYLKDLRAKEKLKDSKRNEKDKSNESIPPLTLSRAQPAVFPFRKTKYNKLKQSVKIPYPVTVNQLEFIGFSGQSRSGGSFFSYPIFKEVSTSRSLPNRSSNTAPKPLGHSLNKSL